ncbi:unnamed protein product [Mycena citricolor]|uniref:Uncharacterized protein n=1 Tax=Mycena citricolor TaxID=2018698 RepID=A0AAD2GR75_9AGAR|nr:unnamed protein product [Mycena citricolor]CAK5262423.1 unnamed protein product [Mycena citricolor]
MFSSFRVSSMNSKLLCILNLLLGPSTAVAQSLNFSASQWLWITPVNQQSIQGAFRKDFSPPFGRSLIAAEIIIATANTDMNFFMNGQLLGPVSRPDLSDQSTASHFCVDTEPSLNVFAINSTMIDHFTTPGFIATILVTYDNLRTDILLSDPSWRASVTSPDGWPELSFDDTAWITASAAPVNVPATKLASLPLSFDGSVWIWNRAVLGGPIPSGPCWFRSTWTPTVANQLPASVDIAVLAVDQYTLIVNGVILGGGSSNIVADHWVVHFTSPPPTIVFAAVAQNNVNGAAAGFIATAVITMRPTGRANCTATLAVQTQEIGWKATSNASLVTSAWFQMGFDDSAWPEAGDEASYGESFLRLPGTVNIAPASPAVVIP